MTGMLYCLPFYRRIRFLPSVQCIGEIFVPYEQTPTCVNKKQDIVITFQQVKGMDPFIGIHSVDNASVALGYDLPLASCHSFLPVTHATHKKVGGLTRNRVSIKKKIPFHLITGFAFIQPKKGRQFATGGSSFKYQRTFNACLY